MITVVGPQWELPAVLARSVQRFGLASEVRATGRPSSGQNARLRGGIEKETEGVTLVATRHSPRQFPLPPCGRPRFPQPTEGRAEGGQSYWRKRVSLGGA